jgi:broad-specificity NMP kinase
MLYLSGLTGVGKTTFIEKHLSKAPNVTVYYGEEQQKHWAEDKSDNLKVLFIDEANITPRQWSEFEGLFRKKPSIVIEGQLYTLSEDNSHVVVFAGNP